MSFLFNSFGSLLPADRPIQQVQIAWHALAGGAAVLISAQRAALCCCASSNWRN